MKTIINIIIPTLLMASGLSGCYYDSEEELFQFVVDPDCNTVEATYAADILPILEAYCIRCHRNDRQDGNVNLEGYQHTKVYADNGALYGSTNHESGYAAMPTSGNKIPFCEIEKMRIWIENGAANN